MQGSPECESYSAALAEAVAESELSYEKRPEWLRDLQTARNAVKPPAKRKR